MEEQNLKGVLGAVAIASCCAAVVIPSVVVAVGTAGGLAFAFVKLKRLLLNRLFGKEVCTC